MLPSVSIADYLGIVDRTATRDTLAIPFTLLDSVGNPASLSSGDSVYVQVISPGGVEVFRDSMAYNDASIDSDAWEDFAGGQVYTYTERVSVLDGSSSAVGVFAIKIWAHDLTSASLITPSTHTFQIVNSTLEGSLDSAAFAQKAVDSLADVLDSLETISTWIQDSLYAVIDSLQNQDNWIAQQIEVANVNGWAPLHDNDSLIVDQSTLEDLIILGVTNTVSIGGADMHRISDSIWAHIDSAWSANTMGSKLRDSLTSKDAIASAVWNVAFASGFTAGSMGDSLNNSTYVQGGASDSASIARWVWNTPQSNHIAASTFGKYLDSEVSGIGSGSGIYSYKVITYDSAVNQPVSGVSIAVRNLDQSALVAVASSDLNGLGAVNLDADSHTVVVRSPGYIFSPFDTIAVTGAGVDTVFGYQFDPGTPSSPNLCRVFGYLLNIDGSPETNGNITAHLPKGVTRISGSIVSPFTISTSTDSLGYWALDIVPNTLLTPSTSQYEFLITRKDGTILRKRVVVPDQTNWQLTW